MQWKLFLNYNEGRIELLKDDEVISYREWKEERNTGQEILNALTSMKEEKALQWSEVPEFQLELELPPHATARRIAETFQKTYTVFVAYE